MTQQVFKPLIDQKRKMVSTPLKARLESIISTSGEASEKLYQFWRHFNEIDMIMFPPVAAQNEDESIKLDVWRLGAEEATLLELKDGKPKLAGAMLGAFGAFLKEEWRLNDILWGRLDAAEVLIKQLMAFDEHRSVPADQEEIKKAIAEAQEAIWKDFWQGLSAKRRNLFTLMYRNASDHTPVKDVIASRNANFKIGYEENLQHLATAFNHIPEFVNPTVPENQGPSRPETPSAGVQLERVWRNLWRGLFLVGVLGVLILIQAYRSQPLATLAGVIGGMLMIPLLIAGLWRLLRLYTGWRSQHP